MSGFGGAVKLTGESEYRKALSLITQNLKEVTSEMKLVSSSFDKNDKSVQALTTQQDVLNRKYEEQTNRLNVLKSQYSAMQTEYTNSKTRHEALVTSYNAEKTKLEEIGRTLGETSDEYKEQKTKVDDLSREVEKSTKANEYNEKSLSNLRIQINNAQTDCNNTAKEMDNLGKETKEAGDEADKASKGGWTVFKGIISNLATDAIRGAVDGLKNLSRAIIDLGKQSVTNFADYEQLVGGVETLFGDSADQLIKYSENAYKTSGISANQYMEQATSFSASLLQSLDNDTAKAVEYADRAMTDMSDNANKMGTNMQSIQSAYQGFAKGNYTMLDNLKLGYGGTKTEMERLIKDASEMTDVQRELGITIDASSMSFGNIVNAISVMQKSMDIAGTTAKEAEETISGSMGMMKASWQNLLTGMADDSQDLGKLISNFVDSVVAVARNLIPRIKQVVKGIGQVISGLLKEFDKLLDDEFIDIIGDAITDIITTITSSLPKILVAGTKILKTIVKGISDAMPEISKGIAEVLTAITDTLVEILPELVEMGATLIVNLAQGLADAIPRLAEKIPDIISAIATAITNNLPLLITAGISIMTGLIEGLVNAIPTLVEKIPDIIDGIVGGLVAGLPDIITGAVTLLTGIVEAIPQIAEKIVMEMPKIVLSIVGGLRDGIGDMVEVLGEVFFGIESASRTTEQALRDHLSTLGDFVKGIQELEPQMADYSKMFSDQGNTIADLESQIRENEDKITEIYTTALQEQRDLRDEDIRSIEEYTARIAELEAEKMSIYTSQQIAELRKLQIESNSITQKTAQQHLRNSQEALEKANKATEDAYTSRLTTIEQKHKAMGTIGSNAYQSELKQAKIYYDAQMKENQGYYDEAVRIVSVKSKEWIKEEAGKWEELSGMMENFNNNSEDGFNNFINNANDWLGNYRDVKTAYQGELDGLVNANSQAFLQMALDTKSRGGAIDDETQTIVKNMIGAFDNLPDSLDKAGKDALLGLIGGMRDEIPALENVSEMSADEIVDAIKEFMGIHSPSTVMAKIGADISRGLIKGMNDEKSGLSDAGSDLAKGIEKGFLGRENNLTNKVRGMMQRVTRAVRKEMQIQSPSKVYAQIGDYMAQGIGVGFTDEMKDVSRDITESIPTSIDGGSASGGYNMSLISQFKEALAEMKIELDGEVAGAFVDKTVTNLIYA